MAAPDEFAALAEELRAQSTSSRAGEGDPSPGKANKRQMARPMLGLANCRPKNKVKSSNTQPCTSPITRSYSIDRHGGNYQEYFKLTLAIARSGVPDAENIFVEAASIAKDADPTRCCGSFFRTASTRQPSNDSVTVGTLFYAASQSGADFSPWKQLADDQ